MVSFITRCAKTLSARLQALASCCFTSSIPDTSTENLSDILCPSDFPMLHIYAAKILFINFGHVVAIIVGTNDCHVVRHELTLNKDRLSTVPVIGKRPQSRLIRGGVKRLGFGKGLCRACLTVHRINSEWDIKVDGISPFQAAFPDIDGLRGLQHHAPQDSDVDAFCLLKSRWVNFLDNVVYRYSVGSVQPQHPPPRYNRPVCARYSLQVLASILLALSVVFSADKAASPPVARLLE
nr:MAG TPA: hypothetical protein [Caudoviricetes sp.]